MRLQFQILTSFFLFNGVFLSENASIMGAINGTIGGALAPALTSIISNSTVPATSTAVPINGTVNGTVPPPTTVPAGTTPSLALTTAAHSANGTAPPATTITMQNLTSPPSATTTVSSLNATKASTKFPETCQSVDTLEQSAQCYYALEGIDSMVGSVSLTDTISIALLQDYCDTFTTCYAAIQNCADFDPLSISILNGFCNFYGFVTAPAFLKCAQDMSVLTTPCTDNATETILNFNATTAVKCAKLTAISSCTQQEVQNTCNMRAQQSYQMFINRNIQTWMC